MVVGGRVGSSGDDQGCGLAAWVHDGAGAGRARDGAWELRANAEGSKAWLGLGRHPGRQVDEGRGVDRRQWTDRHGDDWTARKGKGVGNGRLSGRAFDLSTKSVTLSYEEN